MSSGAALTIQIGAVCACGTPSAVDQPTNSAYAPNLVDPIGQASFRPRNIGSGTLKSELTSCIIRPPALSAVAGPDDFVAVSQEPRQTTVDTFHKFQPSSCPLNKRSAPLPCNESTQQHVSNICCASLSLSLDAETPKCHQYQIQC